MPRKRGHKEGSVYQRGDGLWVAAVSLPDGGRKYRYAKTRVEAARKLNEALQAIENNLPVASSNATFEAFLRDWLEGKKPSLEPGSYVRYSGLIRKHIVPALGKVTLAKLTPQQIERFYSAKTKTLSPNTVLGMHNGVVYPALDKAVRWGLLARNVAALVDLPKGEKPERQVFTPDQARVFLDVIRGDRLEAFYVLAVTTGMRQGELLGLRWRDVALDRAIVSVVQNWKRDYVGRKMGKPKSRSGVRQIVLTERAVDALRRHRIRQDEERSHLGPDWQDNDLVFTSRIGTALNPAYVRDKRYYPLLKRAGLPRIVFHELRHSQATFLMELGAPLPVLAEILGHSSIRITGDVYTHVSERAQRRVMKALERLLTEDGE
jgi:integrase